MHLFTLLRRSLPELILFIKQISCSRINGLEENLVIIKKLGVDARNNILEHFSIRHDSDGAGASIATCDFYLQLTRSTFLCLNLSKTNVKQET